MDAYNVFVILIILLVVVILYYSLKNTNSKLEQFLNYGNQNLQRKNNNPKTKYLLLPDSFPTTSDPNKITDNQYNNIWWRYPSLKVGSYKQITNNIRYSNNPDNGKISPPEFSGAFYKDHQSKSNYTKLLPPAPLYNRKRVNYYLTK